MLDFLVGNDALSAIVAFGLVLIPAIFIHELGHFLAAKSVGITILEFGIGFPPRMLTLFTLGETEYTLNWLPIGGFVRPLGEDFVRPVNDDEVARDRQLVEERLRSADTEAEASQDVLSTERARLRARGVRKIMSVNEARPLARVFFLAAGSLSNLLVAIVLFTIIGLMGLPTIVGGSVGVIQMSSDSPLAEVGILPGDLIETIDGNYFENAGQFTELLEQAQNREVTLSVQREDETFEVNFRPENLNAPESYVFISSIAPDSPAQAAGLQADDVIIAFNGESFASFDELPERTQANLGNEITLTVLRSGETIDISLVPRTDPPQGQGAIGIGIVPAYGNPIPGVVLVEGGLQQAIVPLPLGEAVRFSIERIGFFLDTLVRLPGDLIAGSLSPEEARVMSPLAISQFGGVFLQQSIEQNQPVVILNYIAVISIALGITNLLPLPALDGGRIVFVLIEMVRGRPIAPERESIVHLIGMALLLSLMAIAFLNDVLNPVTNLLP